MLSLQEQQQILVDLTEVLGAAGNIREFVRVVFLRGHQDILASLPTDLNTVADQSSWLLYYCLWSEWEFDPSLMEYLLARLIAKGRVSHVAARDRIHRKEYPPDDVFDHKWIHDEMPFFDRRGLRLQLRSVLSRSGQPIVRINGPDGSGKSYTHEFLDYLAGGHRQNLHVVYKELPLGLGPSLTAQDLAESLVAPMPIQGNNTPDRTGSSYPAILCRWVLRSAMQSSGVWVFVLDGFDQKDVSDETRLLIQSLAQEISAGEYRKRLRLFLINYKSEIPRILGPKIAEDVAGPPSEDDILDCLAAHYRERPPTGNLTVDVNELRAAARRIIGEAPPSGRPQLVSLFDQLTALRCGNRPSGGARP
jgi:hypothetical protein